MSGAGIREWRVAVVVCINLTVGALHFVTGPQYYGPGRQFVNGYLIDVALPFAAYFLLVLNEEKLAFLRAWVVKSAIVFVVVSSAEISQYLGKPIFGETYDPLDFAAYAAGALLAAAADRLLFPRVLPFWVQRVTSTVEPAGRAGPRSPVRQ